MILLLPQGPCRCREDRQRATKAHLLWIETAVNNALGGSHRRIRCCPWCGGRLKRYQTRR